MDPTARKSIAKTLVQMEHDNYWHSFTPLALHNAAQTAQYTS